MHDYQRCNVSQRFQKAVRVGNVFHYIHQEYYVELIFDIFGRADAKLDSLILVGEIC